MWTKKCSYNVMIIMEKLLNCSSPKGTQSWTNQAFQSGIVRKIYEPLPCTCSRSKVRAFFLHTIFRTWALWAVCACWAPQTYLTLQVGAGRGGGGAHWLFGSAGGTVLLTRQGRGKSMVGQFKNRQQDCQHDIKYLPKKTQQYQQATSDDFLGTECVWWIASLSCTHPFI